MAEEGVSECDPACEASPEKDSEEQCSTASATFHTHAKKPFTGPEKPQICKDGLNESPSP